MVPTESFHNSSTRAHASELPSHGRVVRPSVATREGSGDAAAHGEHGQHLDHDGGISGRQNYANVGGDPERDYVKWMRERVAHGHEESVLTTKRALSS